MSQKRKPLIVENDGKTYIYDLLRKKYVVCTPEEKVRQTFIHYLVNDLKYPRGLISVETGLHYNKKQKRTDVVVYNTDGKPHILVECKSEQAGITKEAIFQLAVYNKELDAGILVLVDGKEMLCLQVDREENSLKPLGEVPAYKK